MKYKFVEHLAKKITQADIMRHKSSQGCDVDIYIQNDLMTVGITKIPPKMRLGRIAAHSGDEVYYILRGKCIVELPRHEQEVYLSEGDIFHIPAGQIHAPRNDFNEEVDIFWVCSPSWP